MWIVHSPELLVTLEKGDVSALEASSMAARTGPLCAELAPAPVAVPDPPPPGAFASPLRTRCWCAEAELVWLAANSPKEAMTIKQMMIEARRRMRARGNSTPLH